ALIAWLPSKNRGQWLTSHHPPARRLAVEMVRPPSCRRIKSSVIPVSMGGSAPALGAGEPVWGATVFRLCQTVPDGFRALLQVGGSPSDSIRPRPTYRIRMACKRSGVRIPVAPLGIPGQSTSSGPSGWVPRSVDRHLTVVLGVADRH